MVNPATVENERQNHYILNKTEYKNKIRQNAFIIKRGVPQLPICASTPDYQFIPIYTGTSNQHGCLHCEQDKVSFLYFISGPNCFLLQFKAYFSTTEPIDIEACNCKSVGKILN